MRREHFVPEPARANLRMENDLLKYEVLYLRRRVAALQTELAERPEPVPEPEVVVVPAEPSPRLIAAEKDLMWLLRRLDSPPLGWVARRRSGFRNLRHRWIEGAE